MLFLADGVTTGIDISSITPAISSLMSIGFTAWFSYYTTTVVMPNQQKEHREAIKELTETHANTIKDLVSELRATRESYDRWRMPAH